MLLSKMLTHHQLNHRQTSLIQLLEKVVRLDDLVDYFLRIYIIFLLDVSLNQHYLCIQLGKYDSTFIAI